jgi:hypothetical protein
MKTSEKEILIERGVGTDIDVTNGIHRPTKNRIQSTHLPPRLGSSV